MSSTPPETDGAAPAGARPDEPRSLRIEDWLTVAIMAALALITF
ncbi:MAG: TRAP transporter small permease, partial [Acidovorax sp.]|nr:TRAP transporter small permease [Acidovorax sp.]